MGPILCQQSSEKKDNAPTLWKLSPLAGGVVCDSWPFVHTKLK